MPVRSAIAATTARTVMHASDDVLVLCGRCGEDLELGVLHSPALIDILVTHVPDARRAH